jgi:hypothetical protein
LGWGGVLKLRAKEFLPWLMVPLAAWLGYAWPVGKSGGVENPPPAPAGATTKRSARIDVWGGELARVDVEELRNLTRRVAGLPPSRERDLRMRLICARWAELDPQAGWSEFQSPDMAPKYRQWFLFEWALLDSDSAWTAADAASLTDWEKQQIALLLLHGDPDLFIEWFRKVRGFRIDNDPAWLVLADHHAEALEEIAGRLARKYEGKPDWMKFEYVSIYQLLARWRAERDQPGACEWAAGLPGAARVPAMVDAYSQWGGDDPVAAWRHFEETMPEVRNTDLINVRSKLFAKVAAQAPREAFEWNEKTGGEKPGMLEALARGIQTAMAEGRIEPVAAYRMLCSSQASGSVVPANTLDRMWGGLPPERLRQTTLGILGEPDGPMRNVALGGIASAWFQKNPDEAARFVSSLPDAGIRQAMESRLFYRNGTIPIPPARQLEVLGRIPPEDRAGAWWRFASTYGPPTPTVNAGNFNTPGLRLDLVASLLEQAPPSQELALASGAVAMRWAELDPREALDWTDRLPDPATRKAARIAALGGWAFHEPEAAWDRAETFSDPGLRLDARAAVLSSWSRRDTKQARAAYESIAPELSPDAAAKLKQCILDPFDP